MAALLVVSAALFLPVEWNDVSIGAIALSVVLSVALALLLWRAPRRSFFAVAAVFCLIFFIGDIVELVVQLGDSHLGLAAIAAVVALVHLAAGGISAAESRGWRP